MNRYKTIHKNYKEHKNLFPGDLNDIKALIKSPEFVKLTKLASKDSFNVFQLFEQDICENTISRLLRFLFASDEVHGLNDFFFRKWIQIVEPKMALMLPRSHCQIESIFNWSTPEGRYIDIVNQVKSRIENELIFVVGIETKILASEQIGQIGDYQNSLSKNFSCPVHMFFLTPDGHGSITAIAKGSRCKYSNVSFTTIMKPLLETSRRVGKKSSLGLFLYSFIEYFNQNILLGGDMPTQANDIVKRLENNPKYTNAISLIRSSAAHHATSRSLIYENLLPLLQKDFNGVKVEWHYPTKHRTPWEFNITSNYLEELSGLLSKRKHLQFFFQLVTSDRKCGVECCTTLILQLVIHKSQYVSKKPLSKKTLDIIEKFKNVLAPHKSDPQQWSPWICIWGAGSYKLQDMAEKDGKALAAMFSYAYKHSLPKIKEVMKKD